MTVFHSRPSGGPFQGLSDSNRRSANFLIFELLDSSPGCRKLIVIKMISVWMKNGDSDQSCSYYQINFGIPDCRCMHPDFGLFFEPFLPVPSLINELNKISDMCSFYICIRITILSLKKEKNHPWDFPGDPVVKNLPCNARDAGSIPNWETKISHAVGQRSPCVTNSESMHLN